jgi:hypothetical protein
MIARFPQVQKSSQNKSEKEKANRIIVYPSIILCFVCIGLLVLPTSDSLLYTLQ